MRPIAVPEECVNRYLAGESPASLALEYGFSRMALIRNMARRGVPIRGRREAELLKNANRTPAERRAQTAAANAAARGRVASQAEREHVAASKERNKSHVSPYENRLTQLLRSQGIARAESQKAAGRYNIDVAIWPFAIEVFGGGWHAYGQHRTRSRARFEFLCAQGWAPIIVWCISHVVGHEDPAPTPELAREIAKLYRGPTPRPGSAWVYRFDGRLLATADADFDVIGRYPTAARKGRNRPVL